MQELTPPIYYCRWGFFVL